ncbi:hypothetical protein GWK47_034228 [Chionoecetes opilio]|uniref:Uncharacterized protein n=1 Tax=Chionoecetes opilio TaxID=41210 RepID=A0A8J5D005_CHIOP|nr:hypothetical protein GWK47_034228 [Chionoecetes opilio]
MSLGVQGIIVSGEASESDEEEFCVTQAKGQLREANASLEQNLAQSIRGPLREQSGRIQHLSGTLSAVQTSTLATHTAITRAARNLSSDGFPSSRLS